MTEIIKLKLSMSNAYLIKGRKTILVDTGSPREGIKILKGLTRLGIEPKDFSLILHTHAHPDHAGSTLQLKRWINVPTAVHAADAGMLASGKVGALIPTSLEGRLLIPLLKKSFPAVKADILVEKEITLEDFGIDGRIIFTPGHTPGSISVLLEDDQAIVGDVIMGGNLGGNLFPFRPNYHYFADDLSQVRDSIKKLGSLKVKAFHVGHGGPLDADAVQGFISNEDQL